MVTMEVQGGQRKREWEQCNRGLKRGGKTWREHGRNKDGWDGRQVGQPESEHDVLTGCESTRRISIGFGDGPVVCGPCTQWSVPWKIRWREGAQDNKKRGEEAVIP